MTRNKINAVVDGILAVQDLEDLHTIQAALKSQFAAVQNKAKFQYRLGDKVSFVGRGTLYTGEVVKINQKTIAVRTGPYSTWRVSPALLRKVA